MYVFGNDKHARGCFREISKEATANNSAVYLTLGKAGEFPNPDNNTTPYIVSSIAMSQKEKFNIVQCFGDRNYTYAFGHDPASSTLEITLTTFLAGASGTEFGSALREILKAYKEARLSEYQKYATLTLGSLTLEGFVVGMTMSTQDQEHNLQSVTILILLVEPQSGD